ncbi:efflux RND transporter periplasmic adaptor subunit [Clostridium pasteurianum]|uniref:efflux RND transporter periplasmic adaptor subunit n=1 Tax=Clostridium pasteurianum TaxID=1501 RepID=UPI00226093FF|nr:efflux RND transporter periplasmic adaptor subunit [Clostridium pasteurianum]UZW14756.1 efflux RND transporter periplasmic adaptor subunit [Clostridium pasteurianum]
MKNKKKYLYIVLIMIIFVGCTSQKQNIKNDVQVNIYTVSSPQNVYLDGEIQYMQQQNFIQDSSKGIVDTINVTDKQQVKKGQALFTYKNETVIQQYESLSDQLKNLQSTYKQIQKQLNDISKAQQQVQKVKIDNSVNNVDATDDTTKNSLKSQLDQNNQQQTNIKKQLDNIKNNRYTTITAPFDGNISLVSNSDTDTNKSILTLTDPKLQIAANVSEKDILKLKTGQAVKITVYGTTEDISGTIRSISTESVQSSVIQGNASTVSSAQASSIPSANVSYYPVYIDIDKQDGFYPGFHVQGSTTAENQLPKIPVSAILSENNKNYVWVDNNGKLKKVEVDVIKLNDTYIQVKSGISFGEKIISKPTSAMKEGAAINATTTEN